MSTYTINFTDPIKAGFAIQPGGFDGPGGATSSSSLRLYGRGALEWGEAVDEDLLRLAETFAGATPPIVPIEGELWYQVKLYWRNSIGPVYYRWDYLSSMWTNITGSVTQNILANRPTSSAVGSYFYATDTQELFRWDAPYNEAAPQWMLRSLTFSNIAPTSERPATKLLVWNGLVWDVPPSAITVTAGTQPADPQIGQVYFDSNTNTLYIFDGFMWVPVVLNDGTPFDNDLDMNGFKITNLGAPTNNDDATTKQYVDTGLNLKVAKSGDVMTGFLTLNADPINVLHAATKQYVDNAISIAGGSFVLKSGDTMTGTLSVPVIVASTEFQSTGSTGWFNTTFGGGIYMNDTSFVRVNGGKSFSVNNTAALSSPAITATTAASVTNHAIHGTPGHASYGGVAGQSQNGLKFGILGYSNTYSLFGEGNIFTNGSITASGNVTAFSDLSLKEDIQPLTNALNIVKQLTGVSFVYKATKHRGIGFIAQDVEPLIPEVVEDVEGVKTLAYGNVNAYLVQAIKEMSDRLEALERDILETGSK